MSSVDITVSVDLEDFDTCDLKEELEDRGYKVLESNVKEELELSDFSSEREVLQYLKELMGLRPFHSKERLIEEISKLEI